MRYRWELLFWLWLAFFFNQADRQVFNIVLPVLGSDLMLSPVQLGFIASVFTATTAVIVPVAGFLGDSWPRKRIVVGSLFAWSAATLATGFGRSLTYFIGIRGLATAGGEAFFGPSAMAMLSAEHKATRARALSIFQTSVYTGLVASGWIGGLVAARFGWRSAFWAFGAAGLLLSLGLAVRLHGGAPPRTSVHTSVRETVRDIVKVPTVRFIAMTAGAMIFVNTGYLAWTPAYLYERFGLGLAAAGLTSMVFHHAFAFVGVLAGGVLSDWIAPSHPKIRLEIQSVALLAGAPFLYLLGTASSLFVVDVALAGFGFFRGLYDSNTYPAFYAVVEPRLHATASGLLICFAFLAGSAAPLLLGRAKETVGLGPGLASLSAVYVLGSLFAFWGAWRHFDRDMIQTKELIPAI